MSIKFPCALLVYLCLSSGEIFILLVRVSPFLLFLFNQNELKFLKTMEKVLELLYHKNLDFSFQEINHLSDYFPKLLAKHCWTTYNDVSA